MPHRVAHAKAYPFTGENRSYVLTPAGVGPMRDHHWDGLAGLTPVIASGSNRAPDRLKQKYNGTNHAPIIVTRAQVHDLDSVYSAHIASYGAIPATLHPSPGAVADLAVTWLDDDALQIMHQTESLGVNYDFEKLDTTAVVLENGAILPEAYAYISRRGAYAPDGVPVALAAVETRGRDFPAMDQAAIMARAHAHLKEQGHTKGDETPDDVILSAITDPEHRQRATQLMGQASLLFPALQGI